MELVTIPQSSKEYWRKINNSIQGVCKEIAENCYNKLYAEYGESFRNNISLYYASMMDKEFDEYIKEDIKKYILKLPVKDKVLLRAAQYQLGDELSAKTEMDRMVEFIIYSFSSHI